MARPFDEMKKKRVSYAAAGRLRSKIARVGRLAVAQAAGYSYGVLANKLNGFNHLYREDVDRLERAIQRVSDRRAAPDQAEVVEAA